MKILVTLKRVVDYNVRVRVKSDGSGVETEGVKMSINPFDEIALEEALRLREAGIANEVVVVSMGDEACQQQLRTGLAMGADRAIQVALDGTLQPLGLARTLKAVIDREQPNLVIMGKQAIDGDHSQVGQMLAAIWDRPQATFASELVIEGTVARVTREVDAGLETIEVDLPAVVTTDLRLNEPRFVKLPDIMKAKRKPLDVIPFAELDVDAGVEHVIEAHEPPAQRGGGRKVADVAELVSELKQRGLV